VLLRLHNLMLSALALGTVWLLGKLTQLTLLERWLIVVGIFLLLTSLWGYHELRLERDRARLRVSIGEPLSTFLNRLVPHLESVPATDEYPKPWQPGATELKNKFDLLAKSLKSESAEYGLRLQGWRQAYVLDVGEVLNEDHREWKHELLQIKSTIETVLAELDTWPKREAVRR